MLGGNKMTPLQIAFVVILVLIVVVALSTYFVRTKYYKQIDELDQRKNNVLKNAPYELLKEASELNITGQSSEMRKKLENQWRNIETTKYPQLENYLFDAEQATDRYRLGESKNNQDAAEGAIHNLEEEISTLEESLQELIEREQANLQKIDSIKKRYHEVRKSLLAYSFSFGPASESFEEKLSVMENDFTEFSEYTVSGDHEEANEVIQKLSHDIQETENEMEAVPPLLTMLDEVYDAEIDDLDEGYQRMLEESYLFPDDTIDVDIDKLVDDRDQIYAYIAGLKLDEARALSEQLSEKIDILYDKMELELQAKPAVSDLLEDTKKAVYYLRDENHRLETVVNRISQSYVFMHEEPEKVIALSSKVEACRDDYLKIAEKVKDQSISYSEAYDEVDEIFTELDYLNDQYQKTAKTLENYRKEELELKDKMIALEQRMYEIKRRVENERLPGLPDNYLELFFSASDRIEQFSAALAQPKIDLTDVRQMRDICEEDVAQLAEITEEIIRQVELTERVSQRLYRYKDSHKGIIETIRYSESLFSEDYDYDTSLRLVREKLENVAPGAYAEVVEEYENEQMI